MILYGQILNGKFTPLPNLVGSFLELTKSLEGERVSVEFKKESKKRSIRQNSFFHSVAIPHWIKFIKHYSGITLNSEESKQHIKTKFLTYTKINEKGDKLKFTKDTSKLSVEEFIEFFDAINSHLNQWDFELLPLPFWPSDGDILKEEQ